ncbi:MAG: RNA-directed DNA polymerase [Bacteroidales bacterium]|nr:RNA-directed DNA polymerase [Bacteroidales bacterium]
MVNKKKSAVKLHDNKECSLTLFNIDDYLGSAPAAGNRNGSSLNNEGNNGNYWSSTPNDNNNDNNAYNLNFNSDEENVNNNNRNNGQTVRPVSELTKESSYNKIRHFLIPKEQLLLDLYRAYKDARKHKRGKQYQLQFEYNLEENLINLRDELINGIYKPLPSECFIIHDPKMREVFAANFRDRIVHHLFYNYTHEIFERSFIYDSYSCIKNKGTHFGIERLKHHLRSVSGGYSKPCYVLKIDIKGYFMNINRNILLELSRVILSKNNNGYDALFVDYLLETIIDSNPMDNCKVLGELSDWDNLPKDKSLFHAKEDCGLPIGNLSSQLFSNVYMNVFDQYVKRNLKCRHYGRYVDDAYIISDDRNYLKNLIPEISHFLHKELGLKVHPYKTRIFDAYHGIEFLGAYIKPFRTYISSSSLRRIRKKLIDCKTEDKKHLQSSINSFLGVFSHYDSYCLRRVLFGNNMKLKSIGKYDSNCLRFQL